MSLGGRIAGVREDIADSEALEKGKKAGSKALKTAADGCGFAAYLAAKLVRPLTRRVRDEYQAYKDSVGQEE